MVEPISASIATLDNAMRALRIVMARIDDYQKVGPEAISLLNECNQFDDIISHLVGKEGLPINDELISAQKTIHDTEAFVTKFLHYDQIKHRQLLDEMGWKVQRVYLSYNHRIRFKSATAKFVTHREQFQKILEFTKIMDTPRADWYKERMINKTCFAFWKDIGGQELNACWTQFAATYQREHNGNKEWDGDLMERIRRQACMKSEDTELSIAGFISLTNKCDFPLKYDLLPTLIDSHAIVSTQTRMEVARMVNDLITYYSTKEMRDLLVSIFTWYDGCPKDERQEKANQWARTISGTRGKPKEIWTPTEILAEQVDMARRTYSFFFQRYMVVFKIGQLSKEMFKDVDFPGKARMHEFINNVKPLDKANFLIVIKGDANKWESKQPNVYKFLESYIADEEKEKEKLKQQEKEEKEKRKQQEQEDKRKAEVAAKQKQVDDLDI